MRKAYKHIISFLTTLHICFNNFDITEKTTLHFALVKGHIEIVEAKDNKFVFTPLHYTSIIFKNFTVSSEIRKGSTIHKHKFRHSKSFMPVLLNAHDN
jgi:hypothetical protein